MKLEPRTKFIQPKWVLRPKWAVSPKLVVKAKSGKRPLVFIIIPITLLILISILLAVYLYIQGGVLTSQIQAALQKSLLKNHLQIEIKAIHFSLSKGVTGTQIRLKEINNGPDFIQAERVNLKFSLWELLINPRRPEACVREIEIIKPKIWLERLSDTLWNFGRYFPPSENALQLNTMIRLRDGVVNYRDCQYGSCQMTALNGKINLIRYPLIKWSVKGTARLDRPVGVTSQGEMRADQTAGNLKVFLHGASLPEILRYLPPVIDCRAVSGTTDIQLQLAFGSGVLWMENGKAAIQNANIYLPYFPKPFRIKSLEAAFSPERFQIKKAGLVYDQTAIKIQGVYHPSSTGIDGTVKVVGFKLKDLTFLLPDLKNYGIQGEVNLNLKLSGRVNHPVLDGNITLRDGKVVLTQGESIERLGGRMAVVRNNLIIQQFQGFWRKYPIEVTGTIENILNPYLNLAISGKELNINQLELIQTASQEWQIGNRINFQAGITGRLLTPKFSGDLAFDEFRYQGLLIQSLKVKFGWNTAAKILQADIQGEIGAGRLIAKGMARFDPQMIEWSISGGLSGLNLRQFASIPGLKLTGKISASIVSQGSWRQGEPVNFGNLFATCRGESLTVQDYPVDQAEGVLSWNNGILTIDSFQAKTGQERIFGALNWNDNRLAADFDVENIVLRRLPFDRKKIPLDGILNGNVTLEGSLTDLQGRINGTIAELAWGSQKIGAITGSFSYSNNTMNVLALTVVTGAGNFSAEGSITATAKPVVNLKVVSANAKLAEILKWLQLDPSLKLDGTAQINAEINGNFDSPSLKGEITLVNPQLMGRRMNEGVIQFEGNLSEIRLQNFSLRNDSSYLQLSGRISREDFNLDVTVKSFELAILQLEYGGKTLQGAVDMNGRLAGPFQDPVLTCGITGREVRFGQLSYAEMAGQIKWTKEGLEILEASLRQELSSITVKGRVIPSKPVVYDLEAKVQDFRLQDLKQFGAFPAGFDLAGFLNGSLKLTGTSLQPSVQVIGSFTQGNVNSIPVTGEFNLFYSNNQIIINQIQLHQEEGLLTVSGVWENKQSLKIQIQVTNFQIEVFNSLLKLPLQMGGLVNSQIDFEWSLEQVIGKYWVTGTAFTLNQESLGVFELAGAISESGLTVDEGMLSGKNGSIGIKGYLPWPMKLSDELGLPLLQPAVSRGLDFDLTFKQVSGTLLNPYLPGVKVLDGICNGQLQLKGGLTKPVVSGVLSGKDFKVEIGGLPYPMEAAQFNLYVDANRIQLPKMKGVYGDGKFTLAGAADLNNLKDFSFKIEATGTKLYYRCGYFDGFGDVDLNLNGTLKNALLSGNIIVYDNKVGFLGVEPGGPGVPGWSPKLDLAIKTGNGSRCRVIGFADLAIKGEIRITGTLAAPAFDGEVTSKSGVLTFYNNAFRINQGKAVFKYAEGFNPHFEIDAGLRKSNVDVLLSITGTINQMNVHLSSQPFLSDTELYSLLNWSQLHGDEPLTPQDVVTGNLGVLTDTLLGDFLASVGHSLNVDYLYLEPDTELKGFRISVGTHVTDQLILTYSQSIFNSDQAYLWTMDYYLTPNWVLGYNYSIQEGDSWELAYRIKF